MTLNERLATVYEEALKEMLPEDLDDFGLSRGTGNALRQHGWQMSGSEGDDRGRLRTEYSHRGFPDHMLTIHHNGKKKGTFEHEAPAGGTTGKIGTLKSHLKSFHKHNSPKPHTPYSAYGEMNSDDE